MNRAFMTDMLEERNISYHLRYSNVLTYGLNTFNYYGAHIWNIMPNDLKKCTSINSVKEMIKKWEAPKCQCSMCDVLC